MSVGAWAVMLGPASGAVVGAVVGSDGAVTDGIDGGGVVGVPGVVADVKAVSAQAHR